MANFWRKLRIKYWLWALAHESLFYICQIIKPFVYLALADLKIEGAKNVPRSKVGLLITANHLSQWDIPFLFGIIPRPFFMMAKAEYFNIPFMGPMARLFGGYGVKRGTPDRQALQYTMNLLKNRQIVGLFPEGTRSKTGEMGEGFSGATLIAINTDTLILPVAVWGTEYIARKRKGIFAHPKVRIRIGKPYRMSEVAASLGLNDKRKRDKAEILTEVMMQKIAELLPPEYQGYYAPDKVAARHADKRGQGLEVGG